MDLADLPFKPTKRIKRIVSTIYDYDLSNRTTELTPSIYVKAYDNDEQISMTQDDATYILLDYLYDEGIAEVNIGKSQINLSNIKEEAWIVTELDVTIKNVDKLRRLYSMLKRHKYDDPNVRFSESGNLLINGFLIRFYKDTPAYDLLHLIFIDGDSRDIIWSYSEQDDLSLESRVYRSGNRNVQAYCRDTGYYINRRVSEMCKIEKFLFVNSKSIQLNPAFV